jgi:predicted nuclease with TOPRIM domain
MAANLAELSANMEELDKQSAALYEQLGTLEASLREETAKFDEKKQVELSELLESQNFLQSEFEKSKVRSCFAVLFLSGSICLLTYWL